MKRLTFALLALAFAGRALGQEINFKPAPPTTGVGTAITGTCTSKVLSTTSGDVLQCTTDLPGQLNISGPDSATNVEIGSTTNDANAGTGGSAIAIGNAATNGGNGAGNIAIGSSAGNSTSGNNNIAQGNTATVTGAASASVAMGLLATVGGSNSVGIGANSAIGTGAMNVVVGHAATVTGTGAGNVVLGDSAGAGGGSNGVAIGNSAATGAFTCVALGVSSTCTAGGQFIGGSANQITTDVYFNKGVTSTTATGQTHRGTGGSGSDNAGGGYAIAGGLGTGTAAGGDVKLQRSPSIATGSTAQTAADGLYIRSQFKALTAATATAFARVNIAQAVAGINGWYGGTVFYTIIANTASAAVVQTYAGSVNFACTNLAGTETCAFGTVSSPADNTPTGAITAPTFDANAGTDTIDLRISTDSDQTETTLAMFWSLIGNGTGTITPQ